MELTFGTSVAMALLSCSCLYFVTSPVTAKCRGRWAIHACFGGNGKRSDAGMNPSTARLAHSRLHQLLTSRRHRTVFQDSEDLSPGDGRDTLTSDLGYQPDSYRQEPAGHALATTKADISQTLRALLRYAAALRLQDALSSP